MQVFKDNFFSLFGLEVNYSQDNVRLKERYYQLQKQFHPDNYTQGLPQEKAIAERMAARINEAYQTLKDPLKRAAYLLEVKGYALKEDQLQMKSDFLHAQFLLRERLEEETNKEVIKEEIKKEILMRQEQFTSLIAGNDLEKAQNCVREMQFYEKSLEKLDLS